MTNKEHRAMLIKTTFEAMVRPNANHNERVILAQQVIDAVDIFCPFDPVEEEIHKPFRRQYGSS